MPKPLPPVISEDEVGYATYERIRSESRRGPEASPYTPSTAQGWVLRRTWSGEEYFVPGTERDEWVTSQYNPLDALKE